MVNIFVNKIKEICGNNLKSLVLYGSRASGEEIVGHSDYNLLIVLEKYNLLELKTLASTIKKWMKSGNPCPLFFTEKELKNSIDVFPIEFLDIKQHHKILFGEDLFLNMQIDIKNLRHEIEFELKNKFLKLIQAYILTNGNQNQIKKILISSISTFLILFKHIISLKGDIPPFKKLDALNKVSEFIPINTTSFVSIIKMKKDEKETKKLIPERIYEEYIKEIEKIINFIDNFKEL